MSKETIKEIVSWLLFIIAAVFCAIIINFLIIFNAHIPSASMEDTIMTGDRVLGLRLTYTFGEPQRYDVAIFRFPDNEKEYYVKRILGLPGEKLEIIGGKVYINDSETPLDDDFVKEPPYEQNWGPYQIPDDSYFMMGDNRNCSADSRVWINTFVKREKVLAKTYLGLWPRPRLIR